MLKEPRGKGMDIWEEVIKPEDKELLEAGTESSSSSGRWINQFKLRACDYDPLSFSVGRSVERSHSFISSFLVILCYFKSFQENLVF